MKSPTLATDLDGTFIPLDSTTDYQKTIETFNELVKEKRLKLIFVTGRHLASIIDAIETYGLPQPTKIVCDVGTNIYDSSNGKWKSSEVFQEKLSRLTAGNNRDSITLLFSTIKGLELQESEKQGYFKISYYTNSELLDCVS